MIAIWSDMDMQSPKTPLAKGHIGSGPNLCKTPVTYRLLRTAESAKDRLHDSLI